MKNYKVDPKNAHKLKNQSRLKLAPPKKINQIIKIGSEDKIADLGSGPGL